MQTIDSIRSGIIPIAKEYGLKRVFLFGSYAKGTATEESDVDLLVEKGDKLFTLLSLSGFRLDAIDALDTPVDVLSVGGLSDDFKKEIEGSEVLLYEK